MRTRIAAAFLCLVLALTLAGCVHADRAVTLNSDGTGVYTFTVGLSDQIVTLGGSTLTKSMDDFGAQVERDGGSYSRREDSGYSVWKYVRPFTSVRQLDDFLQQSPQTDSNTNGANGANSATTDTQNTVHVAAQVGFFSTTYHVTGHLSLEVPNANQATRDLLKDARESFAVTMPGWVSEQRGGNLSGNTVTYTVHFGESTTIDVAGGGLNAAHIALTAGGLLLALALFIVGLALLRRRGNLKPAKPAPVAPGSPSPYYMPTQPSGETTFPATPPYPRTSEPTTPE